VIWSTPSLPTWAASIAALRSGSGWCAAATTVQAEMLEARMVNGEAIDIATLCTLASTTVRLSQRLGLERRARNVTPSVGQYLAARTAPATGGAPGMDVEGTE
jgi:hypothetical protein